jgi:hypothetical protein
MCERLVTREEFRAAMPFMQSLRYSSDPKPKFIDPPIAFESAIKQRCPQNTVNFCRLHPEYKPAMGFKLWIWDSKKAPLPPGNCPYVGQVHCVCRHKETGKYLDVTPAEEGDEGQPLCFIPSSRAYQGVTVEQLSAYSEKGLDPRMGMVCKDMIAMFKAQAPNALPQLVAPTADGLVLVFCPTNATIRDNWPWMNQTYLEELCGGQQALTQYGQGWMVEAKMFLYVLNTWARIKRLCDNGCTSMEEMNRLTNNGELFTGEAVAAEQWHLPA